MGGALGTLALLRRFIVRRPAPVLAPAFLTPAKEKPDVRLGATLFGVGWGLGGFCPDRIDLTFVAAMLGGMFLFHVWERRLSTSLAGE